jgi:hypothetical protein
MKYIFHAPYTFSASLTVFEIIKPKGRYAYISDPAYSSTAVSGTQAKITDVCSSREQLNEVFSYLNLQVYKQTINK